jgi:ElaB/YqjD/DUF883 family membrane-anchored ribosome-binding protein
MKNNRSDALEAETPAQLLETLRQLVVETEQLLDNAGEHAGEKISELRERINRANDSVHELHGTAWRKIIAGARRADETIRAHPYGSLAVTLGVSVILGAFIRRSR